MIQTTRLVHHMLVKRRRNLVRLSIVHRPHRPDHRTKPNELHRRCEMDRLVRTVFVPDSRMACREIREFGILQFAPDDALDCKASVLQSKRGLEWLLPIWETMTRKVDPLILAKFFNDPRSARFLSVYTRECRKAVDALTNVVQLRTYGKEFALASSCGLTNGNEMLPIYRYSRIRWIMSSGTNQGGQGWGIGRDVELREILLALPIRTGGVQGQHRELAGGAPPDT